MQKESVVNVINIMQGSSKMKFMGVGGKALAWITVLELTVDCWPFSDQFQHLANQNQFWLGIFPVHSQWDSN